MRRTTGTRLAADNGRFPAAVRLRHSGEANGTVLEIAADQDEGEQCHAYFATGGL